MKFILALSLVLATGARTAAAEARPADFWQRDFPFLESTVDARQVPGFALTNNLTVRGVVVSLGQDTFGCFDTDLLRWSVVWRGEGLRFAAMAPISYAEPGKKNSVGQTALNQPSGTPVSVTGLYPGAGETILLEDPRKPGLDVNELGRGPIAAELGRWEGVYVVEDKAVLHYSVKGTEVHEYLTAAAMPEGSYTRNLEIAPHTGTLQFVVADYSNTGGRLARGGMTNIVMLTDMQTNVLLKMNIAAGDGEAKLDVKAPAQVLLVVKPSFQTQRISVTVARNNNTPEQKPIFEMPAYNKGGKPHWPESVVTRGRLATNDAAYVVDRLGLPENNARRRKVRPSSLCFFPDGRGAVVTFDGDVWIVSGIDASLKKLTWKRIASGLNEPQSIHVYQGLLYVFTRNGLVRLRDLNGDGEIDYYENFANGFAQSAETRNFPMDSIVARDGSFYLAEGGESKGIWGIANGSILKVSPDGRKTEVFADGFRQPYLGYNPKTDMLTASDQQGNWVPTSPVTWVQRGKHYGFRPATGIKPPMQPVTEPLCWIPYHLAQSTAGQAWMPGNNLGPLNDHLLQLDYFRSGMLLPFFEAGENPVQGAVTVLNAPIDFPLLKAEMNPVDGLLYLTGFRIWGSNAREWGGLGRLRYRGKPFYQPVQAQSSKHGLLVQFSEPLDVSATNIVNFSLQRWNYHRTANYGSGHFRMDDTAGQDYVPIGGVLLSPERRSLFIAVPDMKPVMQMELNCRLKFETGAEVPAAVFFTVHELRDLDLKTFGFPEPDWKSLMLVQRTTPQAGVAQVVSVSEGQRVYLTMGCNSCHSTDGTTVGRVGPTFAGLFGKDRVFSNAKPVKADAAYIHESILKPQAKIVKEFAGLESGMPSYEGVLTDAQIESVILFIKSLQSQPK